MTRTRRQFLARAGTTAAGLATVGVVQAQETPTVAMVTEGGDYYFDPIGLSVDPGTTVTFEIRSGSHSTTAYAKGTGGASVTRIPDGADPWNSGVLSGQGTTWEHTFEATGTHDYFCIPHKSLGMVGRIVVGEPGGPAEGSMPPDGAVPKSKTIVEQGAVSYGAFTTGGAGGGADARTALLGAGLLGGLGALATVVYWFGNSEGERYRAGSEAWK